MNGSCVLFGAHGPWVLVTPAGHFFMFFAGANPAESTVLKKDNGIIIKVKNLFCFLCRIPA